MQHPFHPFHPFRRTQVLPIVMARLPLALRPYIPPIPNLYLQAFLLPPISPINQHLLLTIFKLALLNKISNLVIYLHVHFCFFLA